MGVGLTPPLPWRYVHASVKGTSHYASDTPCQDYSLVAPLSTRDGEPVLVLVAADGAGSAAQADIGARLACSAFVEVVLSYLHDGGTVPSLTPADAAAWITHLVNRLATYAYGAEVNLRDLSSTFLAAVLGSSAAAYFQIGDGAIVVASNDAYRPVFWPQSGDYANMTYFLTDETALETLQFELTLESPDDIALLSDGLQMLALKYSTKEAHAPFFRPLFSRLRSEAEEQSETLREGLVAWLESPAINRRTDDDKTLVLATRRTSL